MNNEIWSVETVRDELNNNIRKFLSNKEIIKTLIDKMLCKTLFFSNEKISLINILYYECDSLLNSCKYPFSASDINVKCNTLKKIIFMLLLTLYVKENKHQVTSIEEIDYDSFIKRNNEMIDFLIEKNRKYGNAALNPIRFTSSASKIEQIFVRIDDKLNRLVNRQNDEDEDILLDLSGYFILLLVCYSITKE